MLEKNGNLLLTADDMVDFAALQTTVAWATLDNNHPVYDTNRAWMVATAEAGELVVFEVDTEEWYAETIFRSGYWCRVHKIESTLTDDWTITKPHHVRGLELCVTKLRADLTRAPSSTQTSTIPNDLDMCGILSSGPEQNCVQNTGL